MTASPNLLRRLFSAFWILAIICGPPTVLVRLAGDPLPSRIPSWSEIGLYLRGSIPTDAVISIVAILVWVAWAWMTVGIIVQIIWLLRHREPSTRPILPLLPAWVTNLVAGIGLAAATLTTTSTTRPGPVDLPSVAVEQEVTSRPSGATSPAVAEADTVVEPEYVTEHLDTWWHIAETTLGDGTRWTEIRTLNSGRHDARGTPIGHRSTSLAAGTRLRLPADAQLSDPVPDAESEPASDHGTESPRPSEGFNRIAMRVLTDAWGRTPTWEETRPYWTQLVDLNRDRVRSGDVDLIYVDEVFELPPIPPDPQTVEATADTAVAPSEEVLAQEDGADPVADETSDPRLADADRPTPFEEATALEEAAGEAVAPGDLTAQPETEQPVWTTPPPIVRNEAPPAAAGPSDDEDLDDADREGALPLLPVAAGLAGLGIVAYSLVGIIDRRRRIQTAHRPPELLPTPPPPETRPTEHTLRAAAATGGFEFCDLALRSLSMELIATRKQPPPVVGVHLSESGLRLLLDAPDLDPPEGWTVDDDGYSWVLTRSYDLDQWGELTRGAVHPLPGLVTIGHDDSGGQLLLDLEYLGALQVIGEPDEITSTLTTMAAELAGNHGIFGTIYCVGFGDELAVLERVEVIEDLEDCITDVEGEADLSEPHTAVPPLVGRNLPGGGDALAPVAVLDPSSTPSVEADRLLTLAHRGRVVLAAVGYPTGGHWSIKVADGKVEIPRMGITVNRRNLTTTERAHVGRVVAAANDFEGVATTQTSHPHPPDHVLSVLEDEHPGDVESGASDNKEVRARILGNTTVTGPEGQLAPGKATALTIYLAFHPDGVDTDRLSEALYPGQPPAGNALYAVAKRVRQALGDDPDGNPYLSKADEVGLYRISPRLRLDLTDFIAWTTAAEHADNPDAATAHLEAALELVTGPPFSGGKGDYWVWVDSEGWRPHVFTIIDNTAHRLAELALAAGDHTLAIWAARKIVTTCATTCLQCYKHLIRAAHQRGEWTGITMVWQEYLAAAYDSDDTLLPDGTHNFTDPEIQHLYDEYLQQDQTRRVEATSNSR